MGIFKFILANYIRTPFVINQLTDIVFAFALSGWRVGSKAKVKSILADLDRFSDRDR